MLGKLAGVDGGIGVRLRVSLGLGIELLRLCLGLGVRLGVHLGLGLQGLHLSLSLQALRCHLETLRLHVGLDLGRLGGLTLAVGGHNVRMELRGQTHNSQISSMDALLF